MESKIDKWDLHWKKKVIFIQEQHFRCKNIFIKTINISIQGYYFLYIRRFDSKFLNNLKSKIILQSIFLFLYLNVKYFLLYSIGVFRVLDGIHKSTDFWRPYSTAFFFWLGPQYKPSFFFLYTFLTLPVNT